MDHYHVVRQLGPTTHLAVEVETGQRVAIKIIPRHDVTARVGRELLHHRQVSGHPCIARFVEAFLTPTHLWFVTDYAPGGEVFHAVQALGPLTETEARHLFQHTVFALAWCHHRGVSHRDLRMENLFMDNDLHIKLSGFHFSQSGDLAAQHNVVAGAPAYIAPEVLDRGAGVIDATKADSWSLGVMLYAMLVGQYPFRDDSRRNDPAVVLQRIRMVDYAFPSTPNLSNEVRDLISRLLVRDSRQRLDVAGIRQHPWFTRDLPKGMPDAGFLAAAAASQPLQTEQELLALLQQAAPAHANGPGMNRPNVPRLHVHNLLDMANPAA